jgi:hypothetical protein
MSATELLASALPFSRHAIVFSLSFDFITLMLVFVLVHPACQARLLHMCRTEKSNGNVRRFVDHNREFEKWMIESFIKCVAIALKRHYFLQKSVH